MTLRKAGVGHHPSSANSLYKLAKSRTTILPWSLQKQCSSVNTLVLTQSDPFQSSDLQNGKEINLGCFMLSNLHYFAIASVGNQCTIFHSRIMTLCVDLFCLSLTSLFNNRTWSSITSSNNVCSIVIALPWLPILVALRMPNILALTSNLEAGNIGKVRPLNAKAQPSQDTTHTATQRPLSFSTEPVLNAY